MSSSHVAVPTRSSPQPILFAPHGAPTLALRPGAVGAASRSVHDHAIALDAFAFHPGAGA
jgi:hypothetical protein